MEFKLNVPPFIKDFLDIENIDVYSIKQLIPKIRIRVILTGHQIKDRKIRKARKYILFTACRKVINGFGINGFAGSENKKVF